MVTGVYPDSLPAGTSVKLDIDRDKAEALGVSFTTISDTLSAAMGSTYVNDFPNAGRMQQVIIQADAPARMQIENVMKLYVRNATGGMVPLSEVVRPVWSETRCSWCASRVTRPHGSPAARPPATPAARRWPRWSIWPRSCRRASRSRGPASRCRSVSRLRRRRC